MTTTTCEDYPCCGHLYGECADRPEFTSEYWLRPENAAHLGCDHEAGFCDADYDDYDDDDDTCGCGNEDCGSC